MQASQPTHDWEAALAYGLAGNFGAHYCTKEEPGVDTEHPLSTYYAPSGYMAKGFPLVL